MGSKYLIAILGIAILAVSVQATLGNPVEDLINNLAEKVRQLSDAAFAQFSNALASIMKAIKGVLDGFNGAANNVIGPIIKQIKNIAGTAISKGINITECAVEEAIEEIRGLPDLVLHQVKHCTDAVADEAQNILKEGKTAVEKIVQEVQNLAKEATKCGLLDPLCWAHLSAKVAEAAVKIPAEMAESVGKTLKLLGDLKGAVLKCKVDNLKELGEEAMGILRNVTECIENKSKPNITISSEEYYY